MSMSMYVCMYVCMCLCVCVCVCVCLCVVCMYVSVCAWCVGQFPVWFRNEGKHDNYDKIHSTWVCTQALRDRDFKIKENQKWIQWMDRVLIESKFGTLAYKPKWKVKRFGLKK